MLISQDQPRVETFGKTLNNEWVLRTHEELDATVVLESIKVTLPLRQIVFANRAV